jgi:hypothetical protein
MGLLRSPERIVILLLDPLLFEGIEQLPPVG